MTEPKKYKIENLEQVANLVNSDNIDIFSIDLLKALYVYKITIESIREENPEQTKNLTNHQISPFSFYWVDDHKNDMKEIEIIESSTGEVRIINLEENDRQS